MGLSIGAGNASILNFRKQLIIFRPYTISIYGQGKSCSPSSFFFQFLPLHQIAPRPDGLAVEYQTAVQTSIYRVYQCGFDSERRRNLFFSKYVYWILRVRETGYNVYQIRIQRISDSDITFSGYSVTILSNKAHYYNKLEIPGLETIPKGFLKNYPDKTYTESNKNRI